MAKFFIFIYFDFLIKKIIHTPAWPNISIVTRKEGEKVTYDFFPPKIAFFGQMYIKKNQHIHFLVHGHFSWFTFGLPLVRGPKALEMHL